jgi:hypothetical protein
MPSIDGELDDAKELLHRWERIKTTFTWAAQQHLPHILVLNQEKIWVKFNECIIIKCKPMNADEVFAGGRNMQNIIENEIAGWSGNNRFANMRNLHTCTVSHLYLIVASVVIMHGELFELTSDMIRSARLSVPVGVGVVRCSSRSSHAGFRDVFLIEPVPAHIGRMTNLEAYMVAWAR